MSMIDDKFGERVRSVFDTFEDGAADKGWVELRKKYPKKHLPKTMLLWGTGIAASILVALFIIFSQNGQQPAGVNPVEQVTKSEPVDLRRPQPEPAGETSADKSVTQNESAKENQPVAAEKADLQPERSGRNTERTKLAIAQPEQRIPVQQAVITEKNVTEKTSPQDAQKPPASVAQPVMTQTKKADSSKRSRSFEEFLENEAKSAPVLASSDTKEKRGGKTTSFDVFAGTFVNYFEDNPAQINAGFGVNANIKIAKKVFLSVGAGVSENTIAYENSLPRASMQSLMESFPTTKSAPSTDVKINATLLNLDVPIAVKFYPGKAGNFYLLTGINSNSYINQKYVQSYSTLDYATNTRISNKKEVEETRLTGFDFANSAIIAVGVSQEIGKKNTLIFEPFFKPSLRGLGDKNIRLNTIGLNLKLSINGNK